jgi:hypothetical protein
MHWQSTYSTNAAKDLPASGRSMSFQDKEVSAPKACKQSYIPTWPIGFIWKGTYSIYYEGCRLFEKRLNQVSGREKQQRDARK